MAVALIFLITSLGPPSGKNTVTDFPAGHLLTDILVNRFVIIGLVAGILIVTLISMMMIRLGQLKTQKELLMLEQRLLRSQMNPHFIFNSLMNIQSFMLSNDVNRANNYLIKFARLIRFTLENSRVEYVSFDRELDMIGNYLELQKLRYGNKLDYKINMDKDIVPEDIKVLPMLAHPFLEKAIEQGVLLKEGLGMILVEVHMQDKKLLLVIEDNGAGRKKAGEMKTEKFSGHNSFSLDITKDRIDLYNSGAKDKIGLNIEDVFSKETKEIAGTRVKLTLPLVKK